MLAEIIVAGLWGSERDGLVFVAAMLSQIMTVMVLWRTWRAVRGRESVS